MDSNQQQEQILELRRANEELSFLSELSLTLGSTFSFDEVIKTLVGKAIRSVSAEQGAIVLLTKGEGDSADTLVRSMVTSAASREFAVDKFLVGWMLNHKKPVAISSPKTDERFKGCKWDDGIKCVASVPLMIKSRLTGLLTVFNRRDESDFSDDNLRLLSIIAATSAQIVENARLYGVEQLHDELKATQAQLIQSKKMGSLGALVAGLVHELNTPLGAIKSANDVTERSVSKILSAVSTLVGDSDAANLGRYEKAVNQSAEAIAGATERLIKIVSGLKTFVHLDEADIQVVDLHDGLNSALTLLEHQCRDRVTVERNYGEIPHVRCHAAEINQVFMHLLTNALQAIDGTGSIAVTTRADGDTVLVEISDTGCGITDQQLSGLFDPSFTKKGARVKAGLGLFTSSNIIEKHGGRIDVNSDVGSGSTFSVVLPTGSDG